MPMMNPVSASELAQIRADVQAAACDKTCVIQRKTKSSDGMLSETETWNTVTTTVIGLSEPTGLQLQNFDYKIGSLKVFQGKVPIGTDVAEQDHLLVDGQQLVVQVILTPRSYASLLTVLVSEVQ
jgi:hypothetical protein